MPDPAADAAALVADPAWAGAMLGPMLARPDAGWPMTGRVAGARTTLAIARSAAAALAVTMLRPGGTVPMGVVACGRRVFVRVLAGEGTLDRWSAGAAGPAFAAAAAPRLGPCRTEALSPGSVAAIDGRVDAHRFAAGRTTLVVLTLTVMADAAPVLRDYALPAGTLTRVAATEGEGARATMLVEALGALGGGTTGLAAAATHPAFFVRWAAMRHWLAADVAGAWPALERMADGDPHPEVRAAAGTVRTTLSCRG